MKLTHKAIAMSCGYRVQEDYLRQKSSEYETMYRIKCPIGSTVTKFWLDEKDAWKDCCIKEGLVEDEIKLPKDWTKGDKLIIVDIEGVENEFGMVGKQKGSIVTVEYIYGVLPEVYVMVKEIVHLNTGLSSNRFKFYEAAK